MEPTPTPTPQTFLESLVFRLLDEILDSNRQEQVLAKPQHLEDKLSAQLDALAAAVAKNAEVDASAITLIKGIAAALVAAKDDPAKVQALADELVQKNAALAQAVVENTPAA